MKRDAGPGRSWEGCWGWLVGPRHTSVVGVLGSGALSQLLVPKGVGEAWSEQLVDCHVE